MVLPVALMLAKAIGDLTTAENSQARNVLDFLGTPAVALLAGVLVVIFALGRASGMSRAKIHESLGSGLPGVAGIMLIVAAGGGFKQVLSDSGLAQVIANYAHGSALSPLVLGWLVAVAIRLATGSATVATVTTAGIIGGAAGTPDRPHLALLVLAVGAGSLFFQPRQRHRARAPAGPGSGHDGGESPGTLPSNGWWRAVTAPRVRGEIAWVLTIWTPPSRSAGTVS